MRRVAFACLLVALSVPLAACGGGGVSAPDLSSVAQAAEKTQNAGTAKFDVTLKVEGIAGQAGSDTFNAEGAVDYANRRSRMTMDLGQLRSIFGELGQGSGNASLDMVFADNVMYMRLPSLADLVGQGKPWLRMDLTEVAQQAGGDLGLGLWNQGDPSQALTYLRAAGDFTEMGTETVRGVETTRYKGAIDPRKALDQLSDAQKDQLEKQLDKNDVGELPAEAWIDGNGYLRKFTMSFAEPSGQSVLSTMEFYDFGGDVAIEVPPADEVTDITGLAASGGLGG